MEKPTTNKKGTPAAGAPATIRATVWADEYAAEIGPFDFSRRAGRETAESGDVEAIAAALRGVRDADSAFFACMDAARAIGAEAPEGWEANETERDPAGFADLTDDEDEPFDADGAVVFVNAMTKRAALLSENEDGTRDGHVLEPGEACLVVDGRVVGREPTVKGSRGPGDRTVAVPFTYDTEGWTDPKEGRPTASLETSFVAATARFPSEREFPLAFRGRRAYGEEKECRVLGGAFYVKTDVPPGAAATSGMPFLWADGREEGAPRARAERAAEKRGEKFVARADEEKEAAAAAEAIAEAERFAFFDGATWERSPEPRYVVRMEEGRVSLLLSLSTEQEIAKDEGGRLRFAVFPASEWEAAAKTAREWAEGRDADPFGIAMPEKPEFADPSFFTRPSAAELVGSAKVAEALDLENADPETVGQVAAWVARLPESTRYAAYGSLSELERAWLGEGLAAKALLEALARGDVKASPKTGKVYVAVRGGE